MSEIKINRDDIKQLQSFKIQCLECGSIDTEIEIDYANYPSASWHNTKLICKYCHNEESIQESY